MNQILACVFFHGGLCSYVELFRTWFKKFFSGILGPKGSADERTQGRSDLRFSCVFAYVFPYVKVLRFLYVEITLRFSFIKLYG